MYIDEKFYQCDVCNRQFKEKFLFIKYIKCKYIGVDQGSQIDEIGEQEDGYVNVDVIVEFVVVSGVIMEIEEIVEVGIVVESVEGILIVDVSLLILGEDVQGGGL